MRPALALAGMAAAASLSAAPPPLSVDLDSDGSPESVRIESDHIVVDAGKLAGRHPIPDGIVVAPDATDPGIRFADLTGDGLADLLFADATREAIHLWTTIIRPDLGWRPGWSQPVRSRPRGADPSTLPPLTGSTVTRNGDELVITSADGRLTRLSARALIALPTPPRVAPPDAVKTIQVPEGFVVELVAHEPQVMDPVAFDWGPDGRLWVVEMADYPTGLDGRGQPGGRVKVLSDGDGDGVFESATLFDDGLAFPTGVLPWRDGALIAAAPDLLYLADTDDDGRADRREVLFTGFEPGNQQHRFNGFEWGLDGWIYAANGDSGGTVTSVKTGRSLSIGGRDVRFKPDTGEIETVSVMTQYGLRRNDWGHWFGNNNPVWLWQVTLPERYLRRNPQLAVTRLRRELANYPDPTRVFPVSAPIERPNQPWSLNHVTSACSATPYRDELFGTDFADSIFIAEPVHNVVHREVLEREGAGWRSRRAKTESDREFLASTDNWFRPVFLRTGPDGALWLADMHRLVLEHPEWISPEMQARLDVRAGSDAGRLFRIAPRELAKRPVPNLASLDAPSLAAALNSPNGWQRDTAHRLLLERHDPSAIPALRTLITPAHAPAVRLQALAALGGLDGLDSDVLRAALADPNPWVRCEALRQSESAADPALLPTIAALAQDPDPAVRQQAAFSLGAWPPDRAEPVLAALAPGADDDLRIAILTSLRPDSALFAQLKDTTALPAPAELPALTPTSADRAAVIAQYDTLSSLAGDATRGQLLFDTLCALCHRLHGRGQELGPDLAMTAQKPPAWLLAAILDPAQSVESRYRAWQVTLHDNTSLTGVIGVETANNLVLRLPGGTEQPVLRSAIKNIQPVPGSLMPTGFESALPPPAMADLLQFIRANR